MEIVGLRIEDVERDELYFSKITTYPDNPYFKTDDMAIVKITTEWQGIKDGDFVLVKNEEGVMEGYDDSIFKVSFNQESIVLTPLSSFVPFKEKEIPLKKLGTIKLRGRILGIARSLSEEFISDRFVRVETAKESEV